MAIAVPLLSPPLTLDFDRWYAVTALTAPLALIVLAGYAFWVALAGRPIFRDELMEAAPAGRLR